MRQAAILDFIGREGILGRLEDRVLKRHQHAAINGLPQIGKTQILLALGRRISALPEGPRVAHSYVYGRPFPEALRGFMGDLLDIFPEAGVEDLEAMESQGDDASLLERLRSLLLHMTAARHLVWLVDEFDMVFAGKSPWTEAQYGAFVRRILLDGELEGRLTCVVASRPAVDSLLLRYEQRLNPFISETVTSFDREDMAAYYDYLRENICGRELDTEERILMRRSCGRYPKLLALAAQRLLLTDDVSDALRRCREAFDSQFRDIVYLMAREEQTAIHSFSNIVRCYFNPTADDAQVVERFKALGYVEDYLLPDDPLPRGDYPYPYMTVSPAFVDYLFKNHLDEATVDDVTVPGINDPRVLLGGLVSVLRKITREELAGRYVGRDWNETVLFDCCYYSRAGESHEFERIERNGRPAVTVKEALLPDFLTEGRIALSTPVEFLSKACSAVDRSDTWLLDPINLNDHTNIILYFAPRFAPYFRQALNGDMNDPSQAARNAARNRFRSLMARLKNARDDYAHYLYSGQITPAGATTQQDQHTADGCKKLLRSIFAHLYEQ